MRSLERRPRRRNRSRALSWARAARVTGGGVGGSGLRPFVYRQPDQVRRAGELPAVQAIGLYHDLRQAHLAQNAPGRRYVAHPEAREGAKRREHVGELLPIERRLGFFQATTPESGATAARACPTCSERRPPSLVVDHFPFGPRVTMVSWPSTAWLASVRKDRRPRRLAEAGREDAWRGRIPREGLASASTLETEPRNSQHARRPS